MNRVPSLAALSILFALVVPLADGTRAQEPSIASVAQIRGTPAMVAPGPAVANLDAGDLVAGSTKWDATGTGVIFNDTRVGFLWDPSGGAVVFAQSGKTYLTPNFVFPRAVSPSRTVVGGDVLREQLRALPFLWTPADGYNFLPTPCSSSKDPEGGVPLGACSGGAAAVSADGSIAAGTVYADVTAPSAAARWIAKRTKKGLKLSLDLLAPKDAWSNAYGVSADGRVIVGDAGPSDAALAAARWIDGTSAPLAPVGAASSARFVSTDGSVAIGTATVDGRTVLARWESDGSAATFTPPDGTSLVEVTAINASGTAAVGALAAGDNWAPFLWREVDGFTVLPELDQPAYDRSEALGVSDDGSVVVGALQASVISNGFPRSYGFLWSARTGLVLLTDLMTAWGQADADYWSASAISGDGLRVLAIGNFPGSTHDSGSVVVTLTPY